MKMLCHQKNRKLLTDNCGLSSHHLLEEDDEFLHVSQGIGINDAHFNQNLADHRSAVALDIKDIRMSSQAP